MIAVTGIGLRTPLGATVARTWDALLSGLRIIDHARVAIDDADAANATVDRAAAMSMQVAREAIGQAGWSADTLRDDRTALLIATSKGPVERWLRQGSCVDTTPSDASSRAGEGDAASLSFGLSSIADHVARGLGIGGRRLTISAACASGLLAVIRAAVLLQSGEASRALVVGVEASVHPLFVGSFARLGILSPAGWGCRPFDQTRRGFVMSEAAAALCLEASPAAPPLAWIERYAMVADATHLTGMDEQGRAYRFLLNRLLGPDDRVDLLHAHGTATLANDAIELAAIESVLRGNEAERERPTDAHRPTLYSHKGALGHALGASGVVSLAINVLAHQHQIVPPSPWLIDPLPTLGVQMGRAVQPRLIDRGISLAAGFGGAMAGVSMLRAGRV